MHGSLTFLKKELLERLPPMVFFLVVFHLLSLVRVILEQQYHFTAISAASATIAALVVAKSILLANATPLFHWFSEQRLIHNVLWRIALYMLIIILFQYLEGMILLWSKTGSFTSTQEHIINNIDWPHFWVSHLMLLMLVAFCALGTELVQALGPRRALDLFIHPRTNNAG